MEWEAITISAHLCARVGTDDMPSRSIHADRVRMPSSLQHLSVMKLTCEALSKTARQVRGRLRLSITLIAAVARRTLEASRLAGESSAEIKD